MTTHETPWRKPPSSLAIADSDVHVWRAHLDNSSFQPEYLAGLLSQDEMSRAQKFRFPVHRDRYISRRGILRLLLGKYLHTPPENLDLKYTEYGKPFLESHHNTNLRFSLSHSEGLVLFVFTCGHDVGIDLERIKPEIAEESIPERFFALHEATRLRALPEKLQAAAFFELWVRKEACVKAWGIGLSLALDSFDVALDGSESTRLRCPLAKHADARYLTLRKLNPRPGFAAAVAVEGHDGPLHYWNWPLTIE